MLLLCFMLLPWKGNYTEILMYQKYQCNASLSFPKWVQVNKKYFIDVCVCGVAAFSVALTAIHLYSKWMLERKLENERAVIWVEAVILYPFTLSEYLIKHLEGLSLSSSLPYLMNSILCVECLTFSYNNTCISLHIRNDSGRISMKTPKIWNALTHILISIVLVFSCVVSVKYYITRNVWCNK